MAAAVKDTIQEGLDAATGVGVVDRGAKNKPVGSTRLLNKSIHAVIPKHTALFRAAAAGNAVPNRLCAQLDDLVVDSQRLQRLTHLLQGGKCASGGTAAAIEHQNFHKSPPYPYYFLS